MKQFLHKGIIGLIVVLFFQAELYSQAQYNFKSGKLIAGTDLVVGAVYQFSNVATGVDATVTIKAITGGISISSIDGGGGFDHALQPVLSVPGYKNGYLEMQLDFFTAGTFNPMIQAEVPITPIDVDGQRYGGLPLYEFDEIDMPNGYTYFQWAGSELNMSFNGTFARGKNKAAVDYGGIDTAQKTVMFTTVNANISSLTVRVGADNQSGTTANRLRSLYFNNFSYPFQVVLPNRTLLSFSGSKKGNSIELKGTLSASHTFDKLIIEKGSSATELYTLTEMDIAGTASSAYSFTFFDNNPYSSMNFYRVRLVNTTENLKELSNTLMVKMTTPKGFSIMNTMVNQGSPYITLQSNEEGNAGLQIVDMSGRVIYKKVQVVSHGTNYIDLSDLNASRGYYLVSIQTGSNSITQKIVVH